MSSSDRFPSKPTGENTETYSEANGGSSLLISSHGFKLLVNMVMVSDSLHILR